MLYYCIIGGGIDYDSGPYNVTFLPGNTFATFDIPVIYDKIEEDNENFTLSISPQLPPLISHDDVIQAIVILHNIDCKSAYGIENLYTLKVRSYICDWICKNRP